MPKLSLKLPPKQTRKAVVVTSFGPQKAVPLPSGPLSKTVVTTKKAPIKFPNTTKPRVLPVSRTRTFVKNNAVVERFAGTRKPTY